MKIIDTDIAIVGGGASGLVAGIAAARYGCNNITILEKLPRVGKKYYLPVTEDATLQTASSRQTTMTATLSYCRI